MSLSEPDVATLFSNGARHRWEDGRVSRLDVLQVGEVTVPEWKGCRSGAG